jgi:hypothetical protein
MANDITVAISGNPIQNGSAIVYVNKQGDEKSLDTYVKNTPVLSDIEDKFDNRFDDPSYYYGLGNSTVVGG